jgi:hypothetical protein
MSQFKDMDAALAARAAEFDKDLQMGPALPEVEAELFAALTRDLPVAPAQSFEKEIAAVADLGALARSLLAARMESVGQTASAEAADIPAWAFDPETGAPVVEQPIPNPKLAKALFAAGRGQRVHPRCAFNVATGRCDCRDHESGCKGGRPRWKDWKKRATTKVSQIFSWWAKWPDAEYGVAGGSGGGGSGSLRLERNAARRFLAEIVDEQGQPATVVFEEARARGISESTLRRAKAEMGIETYQVAFNETQQWWWRWPLEAQSRPYSVEPEPGTMELIEAAKARG